MNFDLNSLHLSGLLLAGGGMTALIAGWSHVKGWFAYAASALVITAELEDGLSRVLMRYIKDNFYEVRGGKSKYLDRTLFLDFLGCNGIVPFHHLLKHGIYLRKWCILFVSPGGSLSLRSFRGMLNFDDLVATAVREYNMTLKESNDRVESRFYVHRVMGTEKTLAGGMDKLAAPRKRVNGDSSEDISVGSYLNNMLDLSKDRSFAYPDISFQKSCEDDAFKHLYFDDEVLHNVAQSQQWYQSRNWYKDRGIPWRRGWMCWGGGGTGKSSISKAVAQLLGIPLYHYHLSTLSDQEFLEEWHNMSAPCVALFEDFDTVFHGRESMTQHKTLTFECILNALSGVDTVNGVFLVITTNHIEHIDPALGVETINGSVSTRPGRIDAVTKFGFLSHKNRVLMARSILGDWPEEADRLVAYEGDLTPAQFQEMLIQRAFDLSAQPKLQPVA